MANPVATLQINVTATIALLQRLRPNGSFLFMSSSEVYCGLADSMFREDNIGTSTPYHQRASYIEGKRSGEAVCSAFSSQGTRAIAIRLGDVYGPGTRMHDKRALNSFIEKGLLKKKIELLDSGSAMRTYCYVADALELILNILFSGKRAVYNIGGRSSASIAELALLIGKLTDAEVIFPDKETAVAGSPSVLRLDLGRVDAEFAKTEYLGLNEGLMRTIGWQRELYSGGSDR
jgi:nucleoside-diphosphate-sugar epimerase